MKIKKDFILRKVADSYVVVPVGKMTLDFNGIINLNETGAFLFGLLQNGAEREELIEKMLEEYDVSADKAAADIDKFLEKVKEAEGNHLQVSYLSKMMSSLLKNVNFTAKPPRSSPGTRANTPSRHTGRWMVRRSRLTSTTR